MSEEDIRKLLSEPTAARRADVARNVTAVVHADGELSDSERRLAEDPDELSDVLYYAARRLAPTILFRALCIGDRGFSTAVSRVWPGWR